MQYINNSFWLQNILRAFSTLKDLSPQAQTIKALELLKSKAKELFRILSLLSSVSHPTTVVEATRYKHVSDLSLSVDVWDSEVFEPFLYGKIICDAEEL